MSTPSSASGLTTFTAAIAVIFGLVLLLGGIYLAVLGGSWYYVIAGLFFIAAAVLLQKLKSAALAVYAVLILGTVVWGLWEVGSDFFALAPRLDILGLFGLWLLIPAVTRGFEHAKGAKIALSGSLAITVAVMVYAVFNDPQEIRGELTAQQPAASQPVPGIADADWPAYG
ncbi:MAG: membrane-bound PQQ-dependent dehydrogenase, glucose/quinate/shikimate family, partial [Acinetobacter sp.]|nr:membrane-bound PQQ-dependent dehydrogenase, glucose/quinate/shikimate family [Acinetobacter sp.]